MLKYFYNFFWYPIFGRILSKFVFLIEGNDSNKKFFIDNSKDKKIINIKNNSYKK